MIKKLFISLSMLIFFAGISFAAPADNDIYGVYSETYPGVAVDFESWITGGLLTDRQYLPGEDKIDGVNYFHVDAPVSGIAYFLFAGWAKYDMSSFMGGTIEFWVRSSSSNITNIGDIISFGYKAGDPDLERVKTLNELSVNTSSFSANGEWHKFILPIEEATFGNPSPTIANDLNRVTLPLLLNVSAPVTFDLDGFIWKKPGAVEPSSNIGKDEYGVFSETISGASTTANNEDRVRIFTYNGAAVTPASEAPYEGSEHLRTGTAGLWAYEFVYSTNPALQRAQDMSAYVDGALEFYIRVATSAGANYGDIRVGIQKPGWDFWAKNNLEALGVVNNGQWQRVSIPLNSEGFLSNLNVNDLKVITRLIQFEHNGNGSIDVDHITWRKSASEVYGNKANAVYSIYSDWLPVTGAQFGSAGIDAVVLFPWSDGSGPAGTADGTAFEGSSYFKSPPNGGWGIFFVDGSQAATARSMSEFFNGILEFYVRGAAGTNIGNVEVGFKCGGADKLVTLSSFGITAATGGWQKVSIPLNATGFAALTQAVLLETTEILFMMNNNGAAVDADYIVWKKADFSVPSMMVTLNLKNRAGDGSTGADTILWDNEAAISGSTVPIVSGQYLELQLSEWFSEGFQDAAWGLQIYTDNSIAVSSHSYVGMATSTVSGLVSVGESNFIVPMLWRASDNLYTDSENIYADNEFYAEWSGMRDITAEAEAGSGISYYDHSEDIRFLDRRGFKWARLDGQGQPGYGNVPQDGKIYIYFAADFSQVKRGYLYKNDTITMELFYE
ncbi:MAG: hypothetical protein LBR69_04505 [Endomicrobium sp.]|jgi:hypothetical protein|nr:hypothetical protein [Endomicrobium sp.]